MIYFLQETDSTNIKIGYTGNDNPKCRQQKQQTGNSAPLVIIAEMEGDRETDKQLRARFAYAKIAGDWHRPVPELIRLILSLRIEAEWKAGFKAGQNSQGNGEITCPHCDFECLSPCQIGTAKSHSTQMWCPDCELLSRFTMKGDGFNRSRVEVECLGFWDPDN